MTRLITQPTAKPTRKIAAAGGGGILTVLIVAAINHYVPCPTAPCAGDLIGPEVAAALTTAGATIAGWFARERAS